ncbi:MAG: HD domain-containing protein [Deinococcales bacterium]
MLPSFRDHDQQTFFKLSQPIDMALFQPLPLEEGYVVGGAVRDLFLKRLISDIDWLVTSAKDEAQRVADLLGGSLICLDAERDYYRVMAAGVQRDYAPFADLVQDLARRDISFNAMALDFQGRVIDPHGGLDDLRAGFVRVFRHENLKEDPLRAFRVIRFASQLGFDIVPETQAAIQQLFAQFAASGDVLESFAAAERIQDELNKILLSPRAAKGIHALEDLGLLRVSLMELGEGKGLEQGPFHHLDVFNHSVMALAALIDLFPDASLELRLATLLHDIGKPRSYQDGHFYGHDTLGAELSEIMLKRLKYPKAVQERVATLIRHHMLPLPKDEKEARRFVVRRHGLLPDLLKVMIADREAARGILSSEANRNHYRKSLSMILGILAESPPKPPLLNGHEVMALLKLPAGKYIGEALDFLRESEAVGDISTKSEAEEALLHYAKAQAWLADST